MDSDFVNLEHIDKLEHECVESIEDICQINSRFQADEIQTLTDEIGVVSRGKIENSDHFEIQGGDTIFEGNQLEPCHDAVLEEMSKICRCCLGTQAEMRQLFDSQNCFSDVVMMISSIQVSEPYLILIDTWF